MGTKLGQGVVAFGGHHDHRRADAALWRGHRAVVDVHRRALLIKLDLHGRKPLDQAFDQLAGVQRGDLTMEDATKGAAEAGPGVEFVGGQPEAVTLAMAECQQVGEIVPL